MQQMYSCPYCAAIIAYRQEFCNSCGKKLKWPRYLLEQRQPSNRHPAQPQSPDGYPGETPYKKGSPLPIVLLFVVLFIGLSFGGIALATNGAIFNMIQPPVVKAINISPPSITQGQKATLQWTVDGASSVTISPDIGAATLSGTQTVTPTTNTTYTITAANNFGSATSSATITVTPLNPAVISTFTVTPSTIITGKAATLQWNVTGEAAITINPGIGTVPFSGTQQISPTSTTTYTITATNAVSTVTGTATVTVIQPETLVINSFTATPSTITYGQSANLQWNISGADSVTITPSIGAVSNTGTQSVRPTSSTGYCLTATNSSGSKNASASVVVVPQGPPPSVGVPSAPAWIPS